MNTWGPSSHSSAAACLRCEPVSCRFAALQSIGRNDGFGSRALVAFCDTLQKWEHAWVSKSHISVQIEEGTTDFHPTPSQSRELIASSYNVPSSLLLRFEADTIDDTEQILPLLKKQRRRRVYERVLPGTHTTACGDVGSLTIGQQLTPAEAAGAAAALWLSRDLGKAADTVVSWLDRFEG